MAFETKESRIKEFIIFGLVGLVLIFAGLWIGMSIESNSAKKQDALNAKISTKIAVVNQDVGVTYNGAKKNYSEEFIATLDSDFVVVSPQVAQAGLEDGTYGAVLTFPSNLSASVVSINNKNPEKVSLTYVINPNLSSDKYIKVYEKIYSTQNVVSNQMTYTYLSSILQEVHEGQDYVEEIYAINESDLSAAQKLQMTNFLNSLNLSDLKEQKIVFDSVNFDQEYADQAAAFASALHQEYKNAYDGTMSNFGGFKTQYTTDLTVLAQQAADVKSGLTTAQTSYDDMVGYAISLEVYAQELEAYAQQLEKYNVWLAWEYENYLTQYDTYIADQNIYISELEKDLAAGGLAPTWPKPAATVPPSKPLYLSNPLPAPLNPADPDIQIFETTGAPAAPPQFTYKTAAEWIAINKIKTDFTTLATADIEKLIETVKDLQKDLSVFNPDPYDIGAMDTRIAGYIKSYTDLQNQISARLTSTQTKNLQTLTTAYREYETHVRELRGDITEAYGAAKDSLDKSLSSYLKIKTENSRSTKEKLDNLAGMLPYSRSQGNVNQSVVEFATQPIEITASPSNIPKEEAPDTRGTHTLILIIAMILAIVSLAVIFTTAMQKKRAGFVSEPRRANAFFRDK